MTNKQCSTCRDQKQLSRYTKQNLIKPLCQNEIVTCTVFIICHLSRVGKSFLQLIYPGKSICYLSEQISKGALVDELEISGYFVILIVRKPGIAKGRTKRQKTILIHAPLPQKSNRKKEHKSSLFICCFLGRFMFLGFILVWIQGHRSKAQRFLDQHSSAPHEKHNTTRHFERR